MYRSRSLAIRQSFASQHKKKFGGKKRRRGLVKVAHGASHPAPGTELESVKQTQASKYIALTDK